MEKLSRMRAMKSYFGSEGYPPVTNAELVALPEEDREELAKGAAKELGVELQDRPAKTG